VIRPIVLLVLLLVCSVTTWAQDSPNDGLLDSPMLRYLKETGIESQLEAQREQGVALLNNQMRAMLDQLQGQFPMLPSEFREEMEPILLELATTIASSYTIAESLAVYAAPFDRAYPGSALQPAIRELSTPEGRKLVATVNEAISETHEFQRARQEAAMQEATTKLVASAQQVINRLVASKAAATQQGVEPDAE
jgi:hypothetical protein